MTDATARQQPPLRPHERRPRHGRVAAARRGRADVRHGRVSAIAVLRRAGAARHAAFSDQRRALRRLCRRGLCAGHQPSGDLRRHARAGRHQPRHRADRRAERRHPDDRLCRRHQPRPFVEEHDPGMPPGRNIAAGGQGADPGRADEPGSRTAAPRLCRGDIGPGGAGIARRARGCLPRRARFRRRGFRDRPDDLARALAPHPPRPRRYRPRRGADRARQTTADPLRRRHSPVARLSGAAGARRGAVDPGRPHDERQGRHRLYPPALGRTVRPLFADRQRADRGVGLPAGRRLQARRNRDQALCAAGAAHPADPSRYPRRGDRPLPAGRGGAVGRRAGRARGPRRGVGRGRAPFPRRAGRLYRRDSRTG